MVLQKISPRGWPDANAFGGRFERYVHAEIDKDIIDKFINNKFVKKLSLDLDKLDIKLKKELLPWEELNIRKHLEDKGKKNLTASVIRAYKFQKKETEIMKLIISNSYIKQENMFWLHDAVIVNDISQETIVEIETLLNDIDMEISVEKIL